MRTTCIVFLVVAAVLVLVGIAVALGITLGDDEETAGGKMTARAMVFDMGPLCGGNANATAFVASYKFDNEVVEKKFPLVPPSACSLEQGRVRVSATLAKQAPEDETVALECWVDTKICDARWTNPTKGEYGEQGLYPRGVRLYDALLKDYNAARNPDQGGELVGVGCADTWGDHDATFGMKLSAPAKAANCPEVEDKPTAPSTSESPYFTIEPRL